MSDDGPPSGVVDLGLPDAVSTLLTETWGIETLHPPQAQAMPAALSGRNVLLAIPTASGKSLVAYLAIFQRLLVDLPGSQAFYLVPLKALASEKVEELRQAGEILGLKIGMAVGDRAGETVSLDDADIVVATSEKFDSLLRNRQDLLKKVSIVVADEIHLIHDGSRGPTMEINLARIRLEIPDAQILALSATIGNAQELANWLDAELIQSQWRPVTLRYATYCENLVEPRKQVGPDEQERALPPPFELEDVGDDVCNILYSTIQESGQMLLFRGTRRNAESSATRLGTWMRKRMIQWEKNPDEAPDGFDTTARLSELSEIADEVNYSEESTMMSDRLVESIRSGVAFHHAGLTSSQRRIIENAFRNKKLFAICATPTLAAGVNLPARRVIVRDLTRWADGFSRLLPRMEIHQMLGRAGRPRFDLIGDAWLITRNTEHADEMSQRYFEEATEDVVSKLSADPALRVHVLAAIATGGQKNRDSLGKFFQKTFLATSIPNDTLQGRIDEIIGWLATHGFIEKLGEDEALVEKIKAAESEENHEGPEDWDDDLPAWAESASMHEGVGLLDELQEKPPPKRPKRPAIVGFQSAGAFAASQPEISIPDSPAMTYVATPFGERVSRLYLDPLSGLILKEGLRRARQVICRIIEDRSISPWALLHLVASTPDFPPLWPRGNQNEMIDEKIEMMADQILLEPSEINALGFPQEVNAIAKSAWTLESWILEESMREIESTLGVAPGDLRIRVDHATWLLNAAREISLHDDGLNELLIEAEADLIECIEITRKRVLNGCKEDLLALIAIRGVGRVRARTLANHGFRTPMELCQMKKKSQQKLADERGWSPQLVRTIMDAADRALRARR